MSRNGENSTYGSTRGLREGRYGSRIEVHREISGEPTESWSHCTEVLLYKCYLILSEEEAETNVIKLYTSPNYYRRV